jgi:hypothetical protein
MTYLSYNGHKTFQDTAAACGEYNDRDCICGRPNQNSVATIGAKVGFASSGTVPPPAPPPGDDTSGPTITVSEPADGATLSANTTIRIVAEVVDADGVARAELLWKYNNSVRTCGGASGCTVAGSTYAWTLNVGSGDRVYQVRATDAAGNVTTTPERTLHLGDAAPPSTNAAPTVTITSPSEGQRVRRGTTLSVRASAADDGGLATVEMTWLSPSGNVTRSLSDLGGGTWGVNLSISSTASPGTRQIKVTATDHQGASTVAGPVTVQLTE